LLVASETVPSVFGTQDSFEFDLLNSPVKGKVAGKITLEDKEVEVLHHRDNVLRFEELKDQVLDMMYIDSQFVGYKFSGTVKYRVNDAGADVLRGTYTITPMSADPTPYLNVRDMILETLCFEGSIPETVEGGTVDVSVIQATATASPTFTIKKYDDTTRTWAVSTDLTVATTGGRSTLTVETGAHGLYSVTANLTNYAPWTTTIYVD
jgi:hypothetical protein